MPPCPPSLSRFCRCFRDWGWFRPFGDAPESGESAGGDSLTGGELFLVEKFGEVEDFVNLVFWEDLDKLVEFFGGCHDFSRMDGLLTGLYLNYWALLIWSMNCLRNRGNS